MASIIGLFTRTLIVLAFASAALADQANTAPIYSTYQGKGANLTVSKTGPEFTTIAFDGSDLQRQTLVNFVALAALGSGVALLPASVARIRVDGVAYVGLRSSMSTSEVSVLWDPGNPSPLLARALSFLPTLRGRRG